MVGGNNWGGLEGNLSPWGVGEGRNGDGNVKVRRRRSKAEGNHGRNIIWVGFPEFGTRFHVMLEKCVLLEGRWLGVLFVEEGELGDFIFLPLNMVEEVLKNRMCYREFGQCHKLRIIRRHKLHTTC